MLLTIQNDIRALLLTDPWFTNVPVILDRNGDTLNDILTSLGPLNSRSIPNLPSPNGTKCGLVLIVKNPRVETADGQPESAPFILRTSIDVIENRLINGVQTGTGISAESAALRVLAALHGYRPGIIGGGVYRAATDAVEPLKMDNKSWTGFRISLLAQGTIDPVTRTAQPRALIQGSAPAVVTLSSSDPAAEIHYTTNGSWPHPHISTTYTYSSPLILSAPQTVRAIAYHPDSLPSHVLTIPIE